MDTIHRNLLLVSCFVFLLLHLVPHVTHKIFHILALTSTLKTTIMSWQAPRKRFQLNLDAYSKSLRDSLYARHFKRFNLPTFDSGRYIPEHEQKVRARQNKITVGDTVYITEGKHKGKILSVMQYSESSDSFLLFEATVPRIIPKALWVPNQASHIMNYPELIPREHVKLAAKDKDEKGNVFYVVADEIVVKDKYYDDLYKKWMPRRFVKHHEKIEIPWPKKTAEKDDVLSTPERVAYEKTYELQTIAKPPFPKGVLAELRNPYSNYKKKVLTEMSARKLNAPQMPLSAEQKIYMAKKARTPPKKLEPLSDEVKDFIGTRMAAHLAQIDNPALLSHLDALSSVQIPDFHKTMASIDSQSQ